MNDQQRLHTMVADLAKLAKKLGRTPSLREFEASGHSKRQIIKFKYSELCKLAGIEPNRRAQDIDPVQVTTSPPKILIFDLEVAPAIAYTYNFRDAYIQPENIIQMPYILAYSAKFYGEDKIYYQDTRSTPRDDSDLLKSLSKLINEADYLAGHNLKFYDQKMTKGRLFLKNMAPLNDSTVFDTFKIAFKHFKLPFYKLGELAKYLSCKSQKLTHAKFPGTTLFIEADKGNSEAFKEMEDYCKADVIVTEEIFTRLMPWESSINFQIHHQSIICSCGSKEFRKDGHKYKKSGAYQRLRCVKCQKVYTAKANLIDKDIRKGLLT